MRKIQKIMGEENLSVEKLGYVIVNDDTGEIVDNNYGEGYETKEAAQAVVEAAKNIQIIRTVQDWLYNDASKLLSEINKENFVSMKDTSEPIQPEEVAALIEKTGTKSPFTPEAIIEAFLWNWINGYEKL